MPPATGGDWRLAPRREPLPAPSIRSRQSMIVQLFGPVFDLVGDGGFKAFTFSWFTLKYGNVIEMILVVLIFVVGMFINLPGGKAATRRHGR
jgi:hypothetical protein